MSLDLASLKDAVAAHGRVARVVIASADGSSPREAGASMLVGNEDGEPGQSGTIGGGALEFEAIKRARECLATGADRIDRAALGPDLGQCCGGSVKVLIEVIDAARLAAFAEEASGSGVVARPVGTADRTMPLAVKRLLAAARNSGEMPAPGLVDGWMVEPVSRPSRPLWIFGAGHVGRALVAVLAPLPEFAITWVDTDANRFPAAVPDGVTTLVAAAPGDVVRYAPPTAEHLVVTYSHALDLDLCHRLLEHGFAFTGLIGSKTKWARFRRRLRDLGHSDAAIARISCPIGDKALGKHPQAIAIGVAATLLRGARAGGDAQADVNRTG